MAAQVYTLALEFAEPALSSAAASETDLVLSKPTGRPPYVAWLVLRPAARTTIRWRERYGVYASSSTVDIGEVIEMSSSVHPVTEQHIYPCTDLAFGAPVRDVALPPGRYKVHNAGAAAGTFGLLQTATVRARSVRSPLNAISVPAHSPADFAPSAAVYVWLQRGIAAGSVIGKIPTCATAIPFDGRHASKRYRYDERAGKFIRVW